MNLKIWIRGLLPAGLAAVLLLPSGMLRSAPSGAAAGYRSVIDHGANGADDIDDTAAFQKAIDAASGEAGGVVFVPAGRYLISDTLVLAKSAVTLMGEGRATSAARTPTGSMLVLRPGKTNTAVLVRDCSYSGLKNLSIERETGAAAGPIPEKNRKDAIVRMEGTYHAFACELLLINAVCGVEIVNGISPLLEDVDIKSPRGDYGVWLRGSGKPADGGKFRKVDAALFYRLSGGADRESRVEWVVVGPNADGAEVNDARFVAGSRGLVLRGGDPAAGDIRPKYIYTHKFGCDHVADEGVLMEAGNDVFMTNTWIGQNKNASGIVVGPEFTGGLLMTNVRVRGAGGHGMHIQGGRNIYINNPLIGACGTNRDLVPPSSKEAAGILIEAGVTQLRVTGGGVGGMFEQGGRSRQHYGIRYQGTDKQAAKDSVRISGVDTDGNAVPFSPAGLSLDGK
ncbi:glycoside hydrolase family 55 protein [Termitidicoccus mucosus]|uniref:Rhamnogalacturonase A/B/Epimerase-like pectate lyase domain-containing protein n=2 Tax=Termitidicoccus mucosus TaxID=1184151 RepID=A0A178IHD6_9BACT|nr:hypothetical protein AW736_17185 [Opitutaceae bacterium TSB47]